MGQTKIMGRYILVIVIVLVVISSFVYFTGKQPATAPTEEPVPTEETPQGVTGDLNATAAFILQDATADEPAVTESDPSLVNAAESELSGFGQTLDTSEL